MLLKKQRRTQSRLNTRLTSCKLKQMPPRKMLKVPKLMLNRLRLPLVLERMLKERPLTRSSLVAPNDKLLSLLLQWHQVESRLVSQWCLSQWKIKIEQKISSVNSLDNF